MYSLFKCFVLLFQGFFNFLFRHLIIFCHFKVIEILKLIYPERKHIWYTEFSNRGPIKYIDLTYMQTSRTCFAPLFVAVTTMTVIKESIIIALHTLCCNLRVGYVMQCLIEINVNVCFVCRTLEFILPSDTYSAMTQFPISIEQFASG